MTDWAWVNAEGILCRRCLQTWQLKEWVSARLWIKALDLFQRIHADCQPLESEKEAG